MELLRKRMPELLAGEPQAGALLHQGIVWLNDDETRQVPEGVSAAWIETSIDQRRWRHRVDDHDLGA